VVAPTASEERRPGGIVGSLNRLRSWGLERLGRDVLVALVVSRAIVFLAAVAADLAPNANVDARGGATGPVVDSLSTYDGGWYLSIAQSGYHVAANGAGYHDYAFLPLYPLLVRIAGLGVPDLLGIAAVVLSNALFCVALLLLIEVGTPVVGSERARLGAAYLAVSPFSYVFSMAYGESLGLALLLGAFLAVQHDRRALCGILFAFACLTRLQAAALIVPLGLLMLQQDRWRPRPSLLWLALGPAAIAGFMLYVAQLTGSIWGFAEAMSTWGRTGAATSGESSNLLGAISSGPYLAFYGLSLLAILCLGVFLLVYLRPDRIPLAYALIPILFLGVVLVSGQVMSIGRYLTLAFPYAWVLAGRRNRRFRSSWPVISTALMALFGFLTFMGYYVP
jgi:hypothetical protein